MFEKNLNEPFERLEINYKYLKLFLFLKFKIKTKQKKLNKHWSKNKYLLRNGWFKLSNIRTRLACSIFASVSQHKENNRTDRAQQKYGQENYYEYECIFADRVIGVLATITWIPIEQTPLVFVAWITSLNYKFWITYFNEKKKSLTCKLVF